jgi:hypothetical protein
MFSPYGINGMLFKTKINSNWGKFPTFKTNTMKIISKTTVKTEMVPKKTLVKTPVAVEIDIKDMVMLMLLWSNTCIPEIIQTLGKRGLVIASKDVMVLHNKWLKIKPASIPS